MAYGDGNYGASQYGANQNGNAQGGQQSGSPWGSLFSGLGDLYGAWNMGQQNYQNPANSAMPYMNQIPGQVSPYYQPYINAGQQAMPQLQGQYNQLISNPGQRLNQIGQSFQQSPGYQFQVNQSLGAANRAAAAGGMLGSPQEQQNIAGTVNQLANQDYYNWLGNAQNMYGQGLSGLQNINQMGYNASAGLSDTLAQNLQNQANLAYSGQSQQNQYNYGKSSAEGQGISQGLGAIGNALTGGLWGDVSSLGSAIGNLF